MAGIDVISSARKRSVDMEINMIPFVDLLLVTIAFLLVTAVWSHMARLDASASFPGPGSRVRVDPSVRQPAVLHIHASSSERKFRIQWQSGNKTDDIASVEMVADAAGHYRALEEAIAKVYAAGRETRALHGDDLGHDPTANDAREASASTNLAMIHVDNTVPFRDVVQVIDAVDTPRRWACMAPKPRCCGRPDGRGKSNEGCTEPAANMPAFQVLLANH